MGLNQIQMPHVALWMWLQTSESNELPLSKRLTLIFCVSYQQNYIDGKKIVQSFTPKSSIRAIFRPKNYFVCFSKTMQWATWVCLQFFFYFWLFPYSFLSSPRYFTLKSWVFLVLSNFVLRSPEKLKISGFSIKVHWENCKLTTKNARKTEENIRLLTA